MMIRQAHWMDKCKWNKVCFFFFFSFSFFHREMKLPLLFSILFLFLHIHFCFFFLLIWAGGDRQISTTKIHQKKYKKKNKRKIDTIIDKLLRYRFYNNINILFLSICKISLTIFYLQYFWYFYSILVWLKRNYIN